MKKILLQRGNEYRIIDKENMISHEYLPAGTYVIKFDKMSESFFLEKVENFILPEKMFEIWICTSAPTFKVSWGAFGFSVLFCKKTQKDHSNGLCAHRGFTLNPYI